MSTRVKSVGLPWVERYRPASLDDLIAQKHITSTLKKFLVEKRLPHLLFYGPPGTGKTSAISAIAKTIFPREQMRSQVLELNASDDRGIDVVREEIMTFASLRSVFGRSDMFKLVILDEADSMTRDAQMALRRIIEKFTETTRFCIICNYLNKIIPALQSRCMRFRFGPLDVDTMCSRLKDIATQEKADVARSGFQAIVRLSAGDMRSAINLLQSAVLSAKDTSEGVDDEVVYRVSGQPSPADIEILMRWLLNEDLSTAITNMREFQAMKGFASADLLRELHLFVERMTLSGAVLMQLVERLADVEYRISRGASDKLQMCGVAAVFSEARQAIAVASTSNKQNISCLVGELGSTDEMSG